MGNHLLNSNIDANNSNNINQYDTKYVYVGIYLMLLKYKYDYFLDTLYK